VAVTSTKVMVVVSKIGVAASAWVEVAASARVADAAARLLLHKQLRLRLQLHLLLLLFSALARFPLIGHLLSLPPLYCLQIGTYQYLRIMP
jgi:hypothetical protein